MLKIIGESHDEARRLLTEHRQQLDALVEALLARETLNEQEILEVTGLPPAPALDTGLLPVAGTGKERRQEWRMTSIAPVVTLSSGLRRRVVRPRRRADQDGERACSGVEKAVR